MTTRRGFLTGLSVIIAAPAIVRVSSLMKLPSPMRAVAAIDPGMLDRMIAVEIERLIRPPLWSHADGSFTKMAGSRERLDVLLAMRNAA